MSFGERREIIGATEKQMEKTKKPRMISGTTRLRAILILMGLLSFGAQAWADTIDVSFAAPPSAAITLTGPFSLAQTFTAGGNGTLTQVSLVWQVQGGNAQLQITSVAGGLPTGTIFSTAQVTPGSYSVSQFIVLPTTVPITAGTQYSILVTPAAGSTVNVWGDVNSVYAGGNGWLTADQGISWTPLPFPSLSFQTAGIPALGSTGWLGGPVPPPTPPGPPNVLPFSDPGIPPLPNTETPEPSTVVLLVTGLAGLCARLRKA